MYAPSLCRVYLEVAVFDTAFHQTMKILIIIRVITSQSNSCKYDAIFFRSSLSFPGLCMHHAIFSFSELISFTLQNIPISPLFNCSFSPPVSLAMIGVLYSKAIGITPDWLASIYGSTTIVLERSARSDEPVPPDGMGSSPSIAIMARPRCGISSPRLRRRRPRRPRARRMSERPRRV